MNKTNLDKLIMLLESERFFQWYTTGRFDEYTTGDLAHVMKISNDKAREIVVKDLKIMLGRYGIEL